MNDAPPNVRHRILVIDDNAAIHEDIRKILGPRESPNAVLTGTTAALFGEQATASARKEFDIDSAYQGKEGLRLVQEANAAGRPYALAFVDVRMPPGWDGVETITRIWQKYPRLQIVICTAYSDYSWDDMIGVLGHTSNMVVLKKPFDNVELLQLTHALTEKWDLSRRVQEQLSTLDGLVDLRTAELQAANAQLKREIVERQFVEQALISSEERFSKAFQANPIPLAILSLQRETITDANPGFQALTGYSRKELIGHTPRELGLWIDPEQGHQLVEQLRSNPSLRHSPCRLRGHAGTVYDILLSAELIELAGETSMLVIAQDVTEQLQLEKQLRHSQKMEAVGQLAAGIAHDFNNMLTVIKGNASLALVKQTAGAPDQPMLESILVAAERSTKLVRQLLTFSRKQILEIVPLNVGELLATLAEMLPRMLGEQITVKTEAPADLPPIAADGGMIEQVLVNLAVNARDAMPHGGRLTITARTTVISAAELRVNREARAGRFLRLQVSDTGCGIPPEVLPRIFEPFFTTKPMGKGTGLGLSTVYGIARQHEGWIEVQSEVGKGTTFQLFLPLADAPASATAPVNSGAAPRAHGTETILVVEDEETVRYCVTVILEMHGYTVITASNGQEALAVWPDRRATIDLLLTDMVMPEELSGFELARRLQADKPGLKIIYTSGYSRELASSKSPFPAGHHFLAKPYQSGALLQAVRECLDQPAAPATGG